MQKETLTKCLNILECHGHFQILISTSNVGTKVFDVQRTVHFHVKMCLRDPDFYRRIGFKTMVSLQKIEDCS